MATVAFMTISAHTGITGSADPGSSGITHRQCFFNFCIAVFCFYTAIHILIDSILAIWLQENRVFHFSQVRRITRICTRADATTGLGWKDIKCINPVPDSRFPTSWVHCLPQALQVINVILCRSGLSMAIPLTAPEPRRLRLPVRYVSRNLGAGCGLPCS